MKMKKECDEAPETEIDLCPEELVLEAHEKKLVQWLIRENAEFQRLGMEYRELDAELLSLSRRSTLTPQQATKKKVVSKLRDIKKERMNQILLSYKRRDPSVPQ